MGQRERVSVDDLATASIWLESAVNGAEDEAKQAAVMRVVRWIDAEIGRRNSVAAERAQAKDAARRLGMTVDQVLAHWRRRR